MGFWDLYKKQESIKDHDPLNQHNKEKQSAQAECIEIWEKTVKSHLADVQSDIDKINLRLNEQKRRMDAFEVCFQDIITRNSDAIELKDTFEHVLKALGYVKVKNDC